MRIFNLALTLINSLDGICKKENVDIGKEINTKDELLVVECLIGELQCYLRRLKNKMEK